MEKVVLLPDALLTYVKMESPPFHAVLPLSPPVAVSTFARMGYRSDEPPGMPVPPVMLTVRVMLWIVLLFNEARVDWLNMKYVA